MHGGKCGPNCGYGGLAIGASCGELGCGGRNPTNGGRGLPAAKAGGETGAIGVGRGGNGFTLLLLISMLLESFLLALLTIIFIVFISETPRFFMDFEWDFCIANLSSGDERET